MRRFRIADDVAWISSEALDLSGEPTAYVAALPHGPAIVLEATACVLWLALAEVGPDGGEASEITAHALRLAELDPEVVDLDQVTNDSLATLSSLASAGVVIDISEEM